MFNLLKKKIVNRYPQLGWLIKYKFDLEWTDSEKDHVLGAESKYPIVKFTDKPDTFWLDKVNKLSNRDDFFEIQKGNRVETMGCTGYGTLNGLELLAFVKFKEYWNKSDRYINKASGTTRSGNNINNVFEAVRKTHGLVDEGDYTWDRTTFNWAMYYDAIPKSVIDIGTAWIKQYQFNYKKAGTDPTSLREALKYSPVGVGVYAWYRKSNGKYYSAGRANHWALLIGMEWGKKYYILDSYPPYIKELDWSFSLSFPRVFFLTKKDVKFNEELLKQLKEEGYEYIIRSGKNGEFSKIYNDRLEYIPQITDIADEIADRLKLSPDNVNQMLEYLTQNKKLKWLDESGYNKLIK